MPEVGIDDVAKARAALAHRFSVLDLQKTIAAQVAHAPTTHDVAVLTSEQILLRIGQLRPFKGHAPVAVVREDEPLSWRKIGRVEQSAGAPRGDIFHGVGGR